MKLLLLFLICTCAFAENLLFIGDSHTVGPFGTKLHEMLSKASKFERVVTLGHSSSSSLHWMSETDYLLSGGVFHQFKSQENRQQLHPSPTHWRQKVLVPKFDDVLSSPLVHSSWQDDQFNFSTVLIALGANDAAAISNKDGVINTWEYNKRQDYVLKMLEVVKLNNLKCFWVGPPMGMKKTQKNQDVLYKMLKEVVLNTCEFFSSNHYMATGCDGVHFSCSSQRSKAISWAREVEAWMLKTR